MHFNEIVRGLKKANVNRFELAPLPSMKSWGGDEGGVGGGGGGGGGGGLG